jgi:hypothetical protein
LNVKPDGTQSNPWALKVNIYVCKDLAAAKKVSDTKRGVLVALALILGPEKPHRRRSDLTANRNP